MIWLSAQQIADAARAGLLPGLPTTKRGVNMIAERDGWAEGKRARLMRGRAGGGGLEYHVDVLPIEARLAWFGHHLRIEDEDLRPPLDDGPANDRRDARVVLLRLAERYQRDVRVSRGTADYMFCLLFNAGDVALPEWIKEAAPKTLSPRTLARWRAAVMDGVKLRKQGRPKGSGVLDRADGGEVRSLILGAIARQPFLSAKHVRALVGHKYGETLPVVDPKTGEEKRVPLPSVRMFQIALAGWKKTYRNELLRLTDPDGYRNKVEFTATGSQKASRLNEVWQIDASPADVMLKGGRHAIYMAVDVFSRRAIVLATPTPRASAVGLLIRKCLMAWGVPERIHTDNGSDFVAKASKRLFDALGIEIELSPPYNPKSKGIVERTIGTFQRDLATCPGFIGHSVADRKVIESRKAFSARLGATDEQLFDVQMDLAAFQDWCDAWSEKIYAFNPHRGLGGRTPFQAAAEYTGKVKRIESEAALDVLLAPIASGDGLRRVSKQGVRVDGALYLPLGVTPGVDVLVRMDPADLGRVMLFDPESDDYLGEAICPELAGLDPVEVTQRVKAMQKAHEDEQLVDIRRGMRRIKSHDAADALRREGEVKAEVLTPFPRASEAHSTPAIDAAGEAHKRAAPPPPAPRKDADEEARQAAFVATFKPKPKPGRQAETPEQRFRRALGLIERQEAGEVLDEADAAWLGIYRTQAEFLAQQMLFEEFGTALWSS